MGHSIELTIYEDNYHRITGIEFANILKNIENLDLIIQSVKPNDVNDHVKSKLDIRVVNTLKYKSLKAVKILCMYLLKNGIINFKIENFD